MDAANTILVGRILDRNLRLNSAMEVEHLVSLSSKLHSKGAFLIIYLRNEESCQ